MTVDAHRLTNESCATVTIGGELAVRQLGFGAMRLTGSGVWGPPADPDAAKAVLRRAVDLGVNFIDTADAYGPDVNEECIADALHPYTDDLVIATKGGLVRQGPGEWSPVGRPDHLRAACEASLQKLRLDTIDLYQLHRPDPEVPFAESVGALAELQTEGKVRFIGLSNVTVDQLREAQSIVSIASVQNRYNIADRRHEDVLRACEADGLAFLPFFPLAAGNFDKATKMLTEVGEIVGADHRSVGLAWLLQRSPIMLPIPGTSSEQHLVQNINAVTVSLGEAELDRLNAFDPSLSAKLGQIARPLSPEAKARVQKQAGVFRRLWNRITGR